MAVNKVVYGDEILVDLTGDTVTPATLAEGVTAHNKSGEIITGTMGASTGDAVTDDGLGNVTISSTYSYVYADDGEGNLTGTTVAGTNAEDADGNVSMT